MITDTNTNIGGITYIDNVFSGDLKDVLLIGNQAGINTNTTKNFELHGTGSDYAIIKWITGSEGANVSSIANAKYEVIINYKIYKF